MILNRFRPAPSLRWCTDSAQVMIVNEPPQEMVILRGIDAAVWSWLGLNYGYEDVLAFAAAFLNQPTETARQKLNQILYYWVELGLLVPDERP
jgi:hypothetical protein